MTAAATEPRPDETRAVTTESPAVSGPMSVQPRAVVEAPDAASAPALERACAAWYAAHNAVELACSLFDAPIMALFAIDGERLILLASHGLTQAVLDVVAGAWAHGRAILAAGLPRGRAQLPSRRMKGHARATATTVSRCRRSASGGDS